MTCSPHFELATERPLSEACEPTDKRELVELSREEILNDDVERDWRKDAYEA